MSGIRETIKFDNLDVNIKFALNTNVGITGSQQENDNIVEITKQALINPIIDTEVRRFKYKSNILPALLQFYFIDGNGYYHNDFQTAGFTTDEINNTSIKLLNSFYILDLYDSSDPYTQTKILTTYLTKVLNGMYKLPYYSINETVKNQFYYLNIPLSYINSQTSSIVNAFIKYSFYNAKDGGISLFYNKLNSDNTLLNTTPEKMYFKIELNLIDMTWNYIISDTYSPYGYGYGYGSQTLSTNVLAYELSPNSAYVDRVNNTVSNFDDKQQNYPSGNTFIDISGSYVTE
jgi:hypothetical protein